MPPAYAKPYVSGRRTMPLTLRPRSQHPLNASSDHGVELPKCRVGAPKPPLSSPQAGDACTTPSVGDDIEIGPFEAAATLVGLGATQAATPAEIESTSAILRNRCFITNTPKQDRLIILRTPFKK